MDMGKAPSRSRHLLNSIREASLKSLRELGYVQAPASLPVLERATICRSEEDIAARALVLHACCAVSYGFPVSAARQWLLENGLSGKLTKAEQRLLKSADPGAQGFHTRAEAIWMFCWMLGKTARFQPHSEAPGDAVTLLPDLRKMEPARDWMNRVELRPADQCVVMLDFYYCLNWLYVHAQLTGEQVGPLLPDYVVLERRRALEWCFADEDWDWISLDT
ncbi:DUF4272 domain-containing protein [Ramlibacter albus]|uniref:DUF4272 domain-containing protein n=1 Tax=Ramlibacter albus TaxID=2079448 RepID=A0A923S8Z0_9BURK|nr:DUF4272 domain-containing protein [Ramlibacter albus]MBC5768547.1 DUF4272 domain-containing protein [Ramlibacter albus]